MQEPVLSPQETEAAWKWFIEHHIQPSRLFRLARGLEELTVGEVRHLATCRCCNEAYRVYQT